MIPTEKEKEYNLGQTVFDSSFKQQSPLKKKAAPLPRQSIFDQLITGTNSKESKKGFLPNYNSLKFNNQIDLIDMPEMDEDHLQDINQIIEEDSFIPKKLKSSDFSVLKDIFRKNIMGDAERKKLWRKLIGNKLRISRRTYQQLRDILDLEGIPLKVNKQIIGDLDRTFPDCSSYEEGEKMYKSMWRILSLFHIYRPDLSYVQGMTCILLLLFYYYDEYESFVYFTNLMICNPFVYSLYNFNKIHIACYVKMFEKRMNKQLPKISQVFEENSISTTAFVYEWFFTIFSRSFKVQSARVLWDLFFIFGPEVLIKIAVAIFKLQEDSILDCDLMSVFNNLKMDTVGIPLSPMVEQIFKDLKSEKEFWKEFGKMASCEEVTAFFPRS